MTKESRVASEYGHLYFISVSVVLLNKVKDRWEGRDCGVSKDLSRVLLSL